MVFRFCLKIIFCCEILNALLSNVSKNLLVTVFEEFQLFSNPTQRFNS